MDLPLSFCGMFFWKFFLGRVLKPSLAIHHTSLPALVPVLVLKVSYLASDKSPDGKHGFPTNLSVV